MAFGWNSAKNFSPIGIDFGSDSLKALQVTFDEPPRIVAAACTDIPDDARKSPESVAKFVADAIREMLGSGRFKGKRVVASLSSAYTYTQHLRLNRAEGDALTQQMEAELRGRLPVDPSMLVVRHVPVGDVFADGAHKQEVICLAASREYVMRAIEVVRSAGHDVVGMHCEQLAILQAFSHLFRRGVDNERTTLFIDIGAATTKALIAHGRNLVFAKTIHTAGDHFNRHLATQLKVPLHEARLMRIRGEEPPAAQVVHRGVKNADDQGMPMIEDVASSTPRVRPGGSLSEGAATAVLENPGQSEMLEALTDELQLCMGYHDSMFHDRKVDKAVFVGGESRHAKMCQQIAQVLRLPAQLGDPLARLVRPGDSRSADGVDLTRAQPGWAVPLGLCLLPTNL